MCSPRTATVPRTRPLRHHSTPAIASYALRGAAPSSARLCPPHAPRGHPAPADTLLFVDTPSPGRPQVTGQERSGARRFLTRKTEATRTACRHSRRMIRHRSGPTGYLVVREPDRPGHNKGGRRFSRHKSPFFAGRCRTCRCSGRRAPHRRDIPHDDVCDSRRGGWLGVVLCPGVWAVRRRVGSDCR